MTVSTGSDNDKILIVDDQTANLDLLRDMLVPPGYGIFFATSGEQALAIAGEVVPDLILLDVRMPGMDGFETCRRLKSLETLQDIPVIFVTAKTEADDVAHGLAAGAVDYVTKPVKQPEVLARVKTHLHIRALIKQQQAHVDALRRATQELESLNDTKDKFLSNLGRELRTAASNLGAGVARGDAEHTAPGSEDIIRLMATILEWPRLQSGQKLDLLATQISDRELGQLLENLNDLRFLSLAETQVGDEGLDHLRALSSLEELHLDHTGITDGGLKVVASMPNLRVLDLKGTAISDAGLAHLSGMHNLQALYLTRTPITDAGLVHLCELRDLRTLILWDTAISDAGLPHLAPLTSLNELILWNTAVSDRGVADLEQALPECDISTTLG